MLDGGFIKLHRKMIKWEWYQDANTFRVFVHLLLTANYERRRFEGMVIERGQRVTSIAKLSKELKISVRSIRTSLEHLRATNEVTIETTAKCSIITIKNYDLYQQVTNELTNYRQTENADLCENYVNNDFLGNISTSESTNCVTSKELSESRINPKDFNGKTKISANETTMCLTNDRQTTDKVPTNCRQQWKKDKESKRKIKKRERGALSPHGQFLNVFLSDAEVADLAEKYPHDYERKIERLSRYIESNGKDYPNHYIKLMDWLEEDVGAPGRSKDVKTNSSYDIDELEEINTLDYID